MEELNEYVDENYQIFNDFIKKYDDEEIISRLFVFGCKKDGKLTQPGLKQIFAILKLNYEHFLKNKSISAELRENIQDNIFRLSLILDTIELVEKEEEESKKVSLESEPDNDSK